jgi:hypothetical protein
MGFLGILGVEISTSVPAENLLTISTLNSVSYFFMKPLKVCPTSEGQFNPGAIQ